MNLRTWSAKPFLRANKGLRPQELVNNIQKINTFRLKALNLDCFCSGTPVAGVNSSEQLIP